MSAETVVGRVVGTASSWGTGGSGEHSFQTCMTRWGRVLQKELGVQRPRGAGMLPSVCGTRSRKSRSCPVMRSHTDLGQEFAVDSKCDNTVSLGSGLTGLDVSLKISPVPQSSPGRRGRKEAGSQLTVPDTAEGSKCTTCKIFKKIKGSVGRAFRRYE